MQFESNQQGFNTNRIYAWTDFIISHAQVPIKKEKRKKSFVCTVYVGFFFFFFIMGGQSREMAYIKSLRKWSRVKGDRGLERMTIKSRRELGE